jgi:hypothetical protein
MTAGVNLPKEYRRVADCVDKSLDVTLFAIEGYCHLSRPQLPIPTRLPVRSAALRSTEWVSLLNTGDGPPTSPKTRSRASPRGDRSRLAGDARKDRGSRQGSPRLVNLFNFKDPFTH